MWKLIKTGLESVQESFLFRKWRHRRFDEIKYRFQAFNLKSTLSDDEIVLFNFSEKFSNILYDIITYLSNIIR